MTWSVRARIAVACLCCAVVPLVAYATYTFTTASRTLQTELDRRFVEREVAVGRALDDLATGELDAIEAFARWTRFAGAVRTGDYRFVHQQLEALTSGSGGTAQLFDGDGGLLVSAGREVSSPALWRTVEVQDLVQGVVVDMPTSGFETLDGQLVLVSAEYVAPAGRLRDQVGLLVCARPVAGQPLTDVEASTDVRVAVVPHQVASALHGTATDVSSGVLNQVGAPFDEGGDRSVYLAVFDGDGFRSGVVKMAMDRSEAQSATNGLRTMAVVALLLAVLAAATAALLLSRRISRPLDELASAAVSIAGGETRQTIEVRGNDEIGRLAGAFNAMSERVTERVTDLSRKLADLTSEMTDLNIVFGHTLLDAVELPRELERMLPLIEGVVRADATCLLTTSDDALAPTAMTSAEACIAGDGIDRTPCSSACVSGDAKRLATVSMVDGTVATARAADCHLAAAPLSHEDTAGALVVARRDGEFDDEEKALLAMLAGQVAVAASNAGTWQRLESGYLTTIAALAGAIEVKDEYPQTHPAAVAAVSDLLADRLGLGQRERRLVRYAAILHDIGKIGVPERILRKPGPLAEEEFGVAAGHSVLGEHLVSEIEYLRPAAPVVRSIHERWDGIGYPDGRKGAAIPMASRLILVADAYVALTADRPYREALSPDEAMAEIARRAGTQFDPEVVAALVDAPEAARVAAGAAGPRQAVSDRVVTTVLFVDLVDSTQRAAELGDEAWRDELRRFHTVVGRELREHRGVQIDAVGDGVFARFDGAARAVRCALAIGRDLSPLGLSVRAGCHSGEVDVSGGETKGLAIHIGARVAGSAAPGEVLVSQTVKDLVSGSGLSFAERGEHELKGVPGTWRLYAALS